MPPCLATLCHIACGMDDITGSTPSCLTLWFCSVRAAPLPNMVPSKPSGGGGASDSDPSKPQGTEYKLEGGKLTHRHRPHGLHTDWVHVLILLQSLPMKMGQSTVFACVWCSLAWKRSFSKMLPRMQNLMSSSKQGTHKRQITNSVQNWMRRNYTVLDCCSNLM